MTQVKKNQSLDVNDALAQSEAFVVKFKKQIITAVVAAVVVLGGTFAYIYGYAQPREDKAQQLLGVVTQKYLIVGDLEHALKGEGTTVGLQKIADEYGSTDAGNIAAYQAGVCFYNTGKTAEAIKYLEKFDTKDDKTVSSQALYVLANCYATAGQNDKAVETFKKAADATDVPALCAEYLFEAAQVLEAQKKNDEALALYQQVKKDYPTSPLVQPNAQSGAMTSGEIDKYIERLSK